MVKPNLLVTYDPAHENSAKLEVEQLLKSVREKVTFLKSNEGVFNLRTKDSRKVVRKLTNLCEKYPYQFNKTFKYIPIDKWSKSSVKNMQRAVKSLAKDIKDKESWMMSVKKRSHRMSERSLILRLTEHVDKPKVDLFNPDKIIKVELIGKEAGFALLNDKEYLRTNKFKQ
jgi:tRNA(Ser,Leu) C12 N-acetylase TAN1